MNKQWHEVRDFHLAFNHPAPDGPTLMNEFEVTRRSEWIKEEVRELGEATTIVDQADAFLDILYFAMGGLVVMGVQPGNLWDIVQGANMAKLWEDGKPRFKEDGKVMKPPSWQPPEPQLVAEIERQVAVAA